MLKDRELENQIQFLEEANDNLNTLESVLSALKPHEQISSQNLNAALIATHAIKSGAGVMGFPVLSSFAHSLEDSLQVLKTECNSLEIDADLHSLLLSVVDWLRQIVELLSVGYVVDEQWLATFCHPVFEELQQRLGVPIVEKNLNFFPQSEEQPSIIPLVFQTELEDLKIENSNRKTSNSIVELTDTKVIYLELLQEFLLSNNHKEHQENIAPTPANKFENINDLFQEITIPHHSLKMQIDRLHKLIRNLSIRVKKLEVDNHELRLAYDKFTTKISTLNNIQTQSENSLDLVLQNQPTDNWQELNLLSQTVIETIAKIQEIANNIELSLADTNQVNRLLNKTAHNIQQSFTQVPLSPSLVRVLLVESNYMLLAFPIDTVAEIRLLEQEQILLSAKSEFLNWRDSTLQLIRLNHYLKFNYLRPTTSALETSPLIDAASVLIIKIGNQAVAVQIDRCWGERKVTIQSVEGNIPLPTGFSNCTILENGQIVPLVNVSDLLQMSENYCKP